MKYIPHLLKEMINFVLGLVSLFTVLLAIPLLAIVVVTLYYLIFEGRLPTKADFTGSGDTIVEPYSELPWGN